MSQRHAVTKAIVTRYKRADKAGKNRILDELWCDDGLAPQPRPEGARAVVEAEDRRTAQAEAAAVRAGSHWGAALLLGSLGAPRRASGWPRCWVSWFRRCAASASWSSARRLRWR